MPPQSSFAFLAIGPAMLAVAVFLALPDTAPRPDPSQGAVAVAAAF